MASQPAACGTHPAPPLPTARPPQQITAVCCERCLVDPPISCGAVSAADSVAVDSTAPILGPSAQRATRWGRPTPPCRRVRDVCERPLFMNTRESVRGPLHPRGCREASLRPWGGACSHYETRWHLALAPVVIMKLCWGCFFVRFCGAALASCAGHVQGQGAGLWVSSRQLPRSVRAASDASASRHQY